MIEILPDTSRTADRNPGKLRVADLFCGAGGASYGIKKHCAKLNLTISKFGRMLLLDSLDDYIESIAE